MTSEAENLKRLLAEMRAERDHWKLTADVERQKVEYRDKTIEEAEAEVSRLRARVEALGKEIAETRRHKNYVEALEDRLHWVLYSGPLNLSENRMRWLHEPFGDDLSKLPPPVAGRSAPRCAECHGSGQISRSYGFIPCQACDGKGF